LANAQAADEEIAIMKYNAEVGVQEIEESATQNRMQASLNRLYGRNAMAAGNINAGTSLLSGFTSAANMQTTYNQNQQLLNKKYG